ncbi:MAG: fatty acid kinase fatty acid binding subunit [Thermotogaceae bacterium]|jgi:DegV family protein with EDD domain|nr:fatty acid kinase fatty acid binding subunit [Thermotogaceae bacterium]MDN5337821.1 fatty acid kinase fatty acid binding subunit [Thermotogaceae bacterium]
MKIKIVTDSTCNLPQDLIEKHDISVVDLKIIIDGKVYRDSELNVNDVVEAIKSDKDVRTSQPAVEDFTKVYEEALKRYDHVISIHLSSKTSGTMNAANLAAKNLNAEDKITIFDSKFLSLALGFIVLKACELSEKYNDVDIIINELEKYTETIGGFFMVGNLDSIIKSGRISKLKGRIANMFGVTPIFTVTDGELDIVKITLGRKRGFNEMIKIVKEKKNKLLDKLLGIVYLNTEDLVKKFVEKFEDELRFFKVLTTPSLAVHAGTELFAVILRTEG